MKKQYFYIFGFAILLAFDTLTQISTKFASRQAGEFTMRWEWVVIVSHNPWLYVAISGYLGSFVAWMTLLRRAPVGPAFAASHLGLVPVLVLSAVIFGEELTFTQMAGALCIVLGIVFLSLSEAIRATESSTPILSRQLETTWFTSESDISYETWEKCFPEPYEGRWWYQAMERAGLDEQFTFFYALVTDQSRPVAIAPAFAMNVPIRLVMPKYLVPLANVMGHIVPSALYQRTFFIGSPCSDEGRVGVIAGVNQLEVMHSLNRAVKIQAERLGIRMRVWKDFPDSYDEQFESLSDECFSLCSYPGTLVTLGGADKKSYLDSLKSSHRYSFKKKLKAVVEAPVTSEVQQQPDAATISDIVGLYWKTYEKGKTKFEKLNRKFFELLAQQRQTYFVIVRECVDGKIVAFMLCFRLGTNIINKFIGIDYSQPKNWFLYYRLWDAAVEWATSVKGESIQSGQTGYTAKLRLGHKLVRLTNYCAHRNPVIHWIYAAVARTVKWETLDDELAPYLRAYPNEASNFRTLNAEE